MARHLLKPVFFAHRKIHLLKGPRAPASPILGVPGPPPQTSIFSAPGASGGGGGQNPDFGGFSGGGTFFPKNAPPLGRAQKSPYILQESQKNKLQSIARPFAPVAQGSADEDGVISEGAARAWLGTGSLSERFASHRYAPSIHRRSPDRHRRRSERT